MPVQITNRPPAEQGNRNSQNIGQPYPTSHAIKFPTWPWMDMENFCGVCEKVKNRVTSVTLLSPCPKSAAIDNICRRAYLIAQARPGVKRKLS